MEKVELYSFDETYIQVIADRGILRELSDYFTYDVPNARFMPAYQNKLWDGKIRLLDFTTSRIYKGLIPYIISWCDENQYSCILHDDLEIEFKDFDIETFISSLNLSITPYDFQKASVKEGIESNRTTFVSPTSSGKSLIIYCLLRYYLQNTDKKILITVPTIGLVNQLVAEFKDYCPSFPIENYIHKVYEGQSKHTDKKIIISTWQSVYKENKNYFKIFDCVFIDEAHQAKADSLKNILEKCQTTKYRFGLTGTLDDLEYHRLVIEGLCGPVFQVTDTKELMDRKIVSQLDIKCFILKYPNSIRDFCKKFNYQQEVKFIVNYEKRNNLIAAIAKSVQNKNVLILTQYIEHIKILEKALANSGKIVYVVHGDIDADEREKIRQLTEKSTNVVIIATYGVFSTGISIKNLQYIIFATGTKSLIRLLQSIGRVLRLDGKANKATAIDIVDEFGYKSKRNYLTKHFFERVKIYMKQKFSYKTVNINI